MAADDPKQTLETLDTELLRLLLPGPPLDLAAIQPLLEARSAIVQALAAETALRPDAALLAKLKRAAESGQELTARLIQARCGTAAELSRLRLRQPPADSPSISVIA